MKIIKSILLLILTTVISFYFGTKYSGYVGLENKTVSSKLSSVSICDEVISKKKSFAAEIFSGKPASVSFNSFPEAKLFNTTITQQLSDGPNFAGHYTVATWGCGTECQGFAIVDAVTGDVVLYKPSIDHQVSEGLSFNLNSNLLVLNPKSDNQEYLDSIKGDSVSNIVANDFESHKARIYYQLIENNNDVYLQELCVENILDGQF
jgi:hypothetical protein